MSDKKDKLPIEKSLAKSGEAPKKGKPPADDAKAAFTKNIVDEAKKNLSAKWAVLYIPLCNKLSDCVQVMEFGADSAADAATKLIDRMKNSKVSPANMRAEVCCPDDAGCLKWCMNGWAETHMNALFELTPSQISAMGLGMEGREKCLKCGNGWVERHIARAIAPGKIAATFLVVKYDPEKTTAGMLRKDATSAII